MNWYWENPLCIARGLVVSQIVTQIEEEPQVCLFGGIEGQAGVQGLSPGQEMKSGQHFQEVMTSSVSLSACIPRDQNHIIQDWLWISPDFLPEGVVQVI